MDLRHRHAQGGRPKGVSLQPSEHAAACKRCLMHAYIPSLTYFLGRHISYLMTDRKREETAYFSSKGQLVIPSRLRREFEITEGTRVLIWADKDRIILKPITAKHFGAVRGSLKGKGASAMLDEEDNCTGN